METCRTKIFSSMNSLLLDLDNNLSETLRLYQEMRWTDFNPKKTTTSFGSLAKTPFALFILLEAISSLPHNF